MLNTSAQSNSVSLSGTVVSQSNFSHEVYGEKFFTFFLSVKRLSEMSDILPVTVSEKLLATRQIAEGEEITAFGQFRSYNKVVEGKSKLLLTIFATDITPLQPDLNANSVALTGFICKPPVFRTTPFAREICDVLLAVNRAYNKSDYIPCIGWGRNARFIKYLPVGQEITLEGRIQSRQYQKKLENDEVVTRTAYEVSIARIDLSPSGIQTAQAAHADATAAAGKGNDDMKI